MFLIYYLYYYDIVTMHLSGFKQVVLYNIIVMHLVINCLPHLPHLGRRWGNGWGYAKKYGPRGGANVVHQMKLVGVRGGI